MAGRGWRRVAGRWALLAVVAGCGEGGRAPAPEAAAQVAPPREFDGAAALRYAGEQVAFGPRVPGSAAHRAAGDWIVARMRERADTVVEQRWEHVTADGRRLPLRNILARFRPGAATRVLYLAHWDSRPVAESDPDPARRGEPIAGANDGASGVGLLVALADVLQRAPADVGVDLLFVDGEDYGDFADGRDVLLGSRWFARHLPEPGYRPLFGVLWDMIGDADLRIPQEVISVERAPEVVQRVWSTARAMGLAGVFVPRTYDYPITDDHVPLLDAGLPVIDVIDLDYPHHHTHADTMDKLSAASLQVVGDVAVRLLREAGGGAPK